MKRYRNTVTGEYVTKTFADAHPRITVGETIETETDVEVELRKILEEEGHQLTPEVANRLYALLGEEESDEAEGS